MHMHDLKRGRLWEHQPGCGLLCFWGEGNLGIPLSQGGPAHPIPIARPWSWHLVWCWGWGLHPRSQVFRKGLCPHFPYNQKAEVQAGH